MNNIILIIQARIGSKRFPGKMLEKISNLSLIEWVIKRVKKTKKLKKIIIATTKNKNDNILKKIAKKNKICIFRGSTKDVLNRYYKAAKYFKGNIIIRVCADNPFVDPEQIELLIKKFKKNNYDYVCNHQNRLNSNYVDGFGAEMFTMDVLKLINKKANLKSQREHVTKYIWDHKNKFRIFSIPAKKELAYPNLKFDIDTLKDYISIKNLVKQKKITINSTAKKIVKYKLQELKGKSKSSYYAKN